MSAKPEPEDARAQHARAIASVEAIFERWISIADDVGYDGYDLHVMKNAKVLDASLGPPTATAEAAAPPPLPTPVGGSPAPAPAPAILSSATTSLFVDRRYRNINGVVHGGAYGVIFDMLTTIALGPLARPGFWDFLGGVTRNLSINYLKSVPYDSTVVVHAHVYQAGRTMAYIHAWMTSPDGRTVYATCDHHKVAVPTQARHLRYRVAWDEQWGDEDKKSGDENKDCKKAKL